MSTPLKGNIGPENEPWNRIESPSVNRSLAQFMSPCGRLQDGAMGLANN